MLIKYLYIFVIALIFQSCNNNPLVINPDHLDKLCQDIVMDGQACTIVHIYADAPDYNWTDASQEGIACVDDVARAAIVYMKIYHKDSPEIIRKIRGLLAFVLMMQTDDGEFYNFIDSDFKINTLGITSKKDFAFWAARGYWALGEGVAFFKEIDPEYAEKLEIAFLRCLTPVNKVLSFYGVYAMENGSRYPTWLMIQYGSDATSEFLLGVNAFLSVKRHAVLEDAALKLAHGIIAMQRIDHPVMNGAIESWPGYWHAWGNSQVQALAQLTGILPDAGIEKAVTASADYFLSRLAAGSTIIGFEFVENKTKQYPQIAYDIRTTALGLLEVYHLTGNENYAILAGLSASWLLGNNSIAVPMYNQETGRIYDGIDPEGLNLNSGAESTIEGLYTLVEILKEPTAAAWLHAKPVKPAVSFFENHDAVLENQFTISSQILTVKYDIITKTLELKTELK